MDDDWGYPDRLDKCRDMMYPLVKLSQHYRKSPFSMGKTRTTISGAHFPSMLLYRMVIDDKAGDFTFPSHMGIS